MLDDLYMRILDMSKVGSMVILVVLLARLLLKRAPKVFSYALWAAVLFRLLCPVSFAQTTISLVPQLPPTAVDYALSEEPITALEAGNAALQAVGDALNGGLGVQHIRTTDVEPDGSRRVVTTDWYDVWILFGQYVWLAGVAGMVAHSAVSYGKLRKKLEVAIPVGEELFLADDLESPFVVGLIRPKIYLPSNLGEKEYAHIIAHERHHIRRGDHIIKALAFLALCIHWFNPLVWLAFHLACKDMEMSCDEAVVRKMGADIRADYAASLLTLATGRRIIAGTPLAFGEGDPKGRIRNLAKWKKPAVWVTAIAVVLCAVLGVCLLTDPADKVVEEGETWYYGTVVDSAMGAADRAYITLQSGDGQQRIFWKGSYSEDPGDILGKYEVVRGSVEANTGRLIFNRVETVEPVAGNSLENAVNSAILSRNEGGYHPQDGVPFASFVRLAGSERGETVTVYGLAFYQLYTLEDGILTEGGGSHVPVTLTFHRSAHNAYTLTEYWEPRDGAYYADDIRAKFPAFVWPDTQVYVEGQIESCFNQALAHFGLDHASATANGFEIRLYADKTTYTTDEEIHLWATLEYQGEGDTVTIWHGLPYITFFITDGQDFNTGGMVATVQTSTTLRKGEVYRFEYAKSGGYGADEPDAAYWENFYQDKALHLPAGTYTVSVNGAFSISEAQRPGESGPSCELQITVTE